MRIVCLINGGDSLTAFHLTKSQYPNDEVIPLHFNLSLPHSKKILGYMPDYVLRDSFRKYPDVMNLTIRDGIIACENPYEPLLWSAIVKHSADKVILGLTKSDFDSKMISMGWIKNFNAKFATKEIVECPLSDFPKEKVIRLSSAYNCTTPVLAMMSCRSTEPTVYGCGNCYNCIVKRTAILKAGRITNIPPITTMAEYTRTIIGTYADGIKSGIMQEITEAAFMELLPAFEERFETSDPFEMLEKMN